MCRFYVFSKGQSLEGQATMYAVRYLGDGDDKKRELRKGKINDRNKHPPQIYASS